MRGCPVSLEASHRLETVLGYLLRLELPKYILVKYKMDEKFLTESETDRRVSTLVQDFEVNLLPIQLLLKPLEVSLCIVL